MKIIEPTLLLDQNKCRANIRSMADKAERNGLFFRPHFKTHQSQEIGRWFREVGVQAITVSSLSMAQYFAADGWQDITVAFPVNLLEINKINQLAATVKLNLLAVNPEPVANLRALLIHPVGLFIKIDVGTHRTGLLPEDRTGIEAVLKEIEQSKKIEFKGFLTHAGHAYASRSAGAVQKIHESATAKLEQLKKIYRSSYPGLIISIGDTPTCSLAENWEGVDEIRPGNFVFYDLMQWQIGTCSFHQIAVALACPVVAKHADRQEVIIYGGAVHLSTDRLENEKGTNCFGLPVLFNGNGWNLPDGESYLRSISQEHGVIKASPSFFEKVKTGDVVGILPVHSCLTTDLAGHFLTTEGERIEKQIHTPK